jgi:deoxyribodipyrimidine photo-lyase
MTDIVLFWHRRDLRIDDNLGLAAAVQSGNPVVGVFCWDPAIFNRENIAPASASYALESLHLLQQEYAAAGSILLILTGDTVQILQDLSLKLAATAIYCNRSVEPAQRELGKKLTTALTIPIYPHWDGLLHAPTTIYSGSNTPYSVYTPYWRNWQNRPKPEPVTVKLPALGVSQRQTVEKLGQPLPALGDLGWSNPQILAPGSRSALSRLELFAHKAIESYGEDRNFPALDGTSTLSPALAWGTLGVRTTWQATIQAMENCRGIEAQESVTVWRQELAWREFYWQALYHFPELAAGPYRQLWRSFPWSDDRERFDRWCKGETGYPIIDAAMRQLNETGWMHNRCRMIVASFLTKDLILNWQWGEQYFMQTLVDGDLAANNGGWQWSASSGMDPKPLRIFNPYTQAQKFDKEGEYIRQWLPELKSVALKELLSGEIAPLWRSKSGYPEPIVNHNTQQKEFKRLYAELKLES